MEGVESVGTQAVRPRHADWAGELRRAGLRVTTQRLAVLEYLDEHPHSNAESIHRALASGDAQSVVTLQAVHGIVNDLSAAGVIRGIDLPTVGSVRYETRILDNHHHVQCVQCGRIEDVDCAIGEAPCLTPSQTHGMRILAASVSFLGLCEDCARATDRAELDDAARRRS